MSETNLPDSNVLIEAARAAMNEVKPGAGGPAGIAERRRRAASKALDAWAPAIDELTDLDGAARFLGVRGTDSLRRQKWRRRVDGSPGWPDPDAVLGRSVGWRYRTIVIHRAEAPGRGQHEPAGDAPVYLTIGDLAAHFGVTTSAVNSWRARYGPGRPAEVIAEKPACPQPDLYVGRSHPQAAWHEKRLSEWEEWLASLPEAKSGPRRTRPPAAGQP